MIIDKQLRRLKLFPLGGKVITDSVFNWMHRFFMNPVETGAAVEREYMTTGTVVEWDHRNETLGRQLADILSGNSIGRIVITWYKKAYLSLEMAELELVDLKPAPQPDAGNDHTRSSYWQSQSTLKYTFVKFMAVLQRLSTVIMDASCKKRRNFRWKTYIHAMIRAVQSPLNLANRIRGPS